MTSTLSNKLIDEFSELLTSDKEAPKKDILYGTVKTKGGSVFVNIDGSAYDTPVDYTATVKDGDRVTLEIQDHQAVVTGNVTDVSASSTQQAEIGRKADEAGEQATAAAEDAGEAKRDAGTARESAENALAATIEIKKTADGLVEEVTKVVDASIGENIIPFPYYHTTRTINGIIFTVNDDGSVTMNGKNTGAVSSFRLTAPRTSPNFYPKAGYYSVSGCPELEEGAEEKYQILVCQSNDDGSIRRLAQVRSGGISFRYSDENVPGGMDIRIEVFENMTVENVTIFPMLESGQVIHEYQPYDLSRRYFQSAIELTGDRIGLIVKGDSTTGIEITDGAISAIADKLRVSGDMIVDGSITATDIDMTNLTSNQAFINSIETNKIVLSNKQLAENAIQSSIGENLIPYPYYNESGTEKNGVIFDYDEEGSIRLNGTLTGSADTYFYLFVGKTLKAGKYTLSANSTDSYVRVRLYSSSDSSFSHFVTDKSTIEVAKDYTDIRCAVVVLPGAVLSKAVCEPMLEAGPEAHPFQPYHWSRQALQSSIEYADNRLSLLVKGEDATGLEITDGAITAIAKKLTVTGDMIVDGSIEAADLKAETITADKINMNSLTSNTAFINSISTNEIVQNGIDSTIGENIIPFPYTNSDGRVSAGVTYGVSNDGIIVANGTASAASSFYITTTAYATGYTLEPGADYTLSCEGYNDSKAYLALQKLDSSGTRTSWQKAYAGHPVTFKALDDPSMKYTMLIYVTKSTVLENYIFKPMLEKGKTAHPYQPYDLSRGSLFSRIGLTQDSISLVVKGKDSSGKVVLTDDALDVIANNINLTGKVTFSSLDSATQTTISNASTNATSALSTANSASSTASSALSTANSASSTANSANTTANSAKSTADGIASNIYTKNTTTIDGGKITTDSITADKLSVTDLQAVGATIGGWTIGSNYIGHLSPVTSGVASTQYQTVMASASGATDVTLYARSRAYSGSSYGDWTYNWYVRNDGFMKATGGGIIGAWTLGAGTNGALSNGMTSLSDTTNNGVWIGSDGIALGKGAFKVTSAGALTATSGNMAGWIMGATSFYKNSSVTAGTATTQYQAYMGAPASPASTSSAILVRSRSYDGSSYGDWANKFYVRYDGYVAAYGGGKIGAWTLGTGTGVAGALYSGTKSTLSTAGSGVYLGSDGIALGNTFKVTNAGVVTATSGTIGGWTMTDYNWLHGGDGDARTVLKTTGLAAIAAGVRKANVDAKNAFGAAFQVFHSGKVRIGFNGTNYTGSQDTDNYWNIVFDTDGSASFGAGTTKIEKTGYINFDTGNLVGIRFRSNDGGTVYGSIYAGSDGLIIHAGTTQYKFKQDGLYTRKAGATADVKKISV